MKPAPFDLHRPETLDDVVALLAEHGDEAKPLAGGQSLVPLLALRLARYDHLVDLERVAGLAGIEDTGDALAIGAMVRQRTAEHDDRVARLAPLVRRALPLIGHFQIRNRGTVGGSLAHADAASELPAVALALGADLDAVGPGGARTVAADGFFVGRWSTALAPDELLVRVRFPMWPGRCGFAVDEVARRHGDFAMVGVAAALGLAADGRIDRARLALFGVDATPVRARAAEAALGGRTPEELSDPKARREIGEMALVDLDPPEDVHATGDYRRRAGAVVVARALARAAEEAIGG
jgi:aerobic carbon-monoxide dehydrogenase medium subunit